MRALLFAAVLVAAGPDAIGVDYVGDRAVVVVDGRTVNITVDAATDLPRRAALRLRLRDPRPAPSHAILLDMETPEDPPWSPPFSTPRRRRFPVDIVGVPRATLSNGRIEGWFVADDWPRSKTFEFFGTCADDIIALRVDNACLNAPCCPAAGRSEVIVTTTTRVVLQAHMTIKESGHASLLRFDLDVTPAAETQRHPRSHGADVRR